MVSIISETACLSSSFNVGVGNTGPSTLIPHEYQAQLQFPELKGVPSLRQMNTANLRHFSDSQCIMSDFSRV